jgi:hypothetical protein
MEVTRCSETSLMLLHSCWIYHELCSEIFCLWTIFLICQIVIQCQIELTQISKSIQHYCINWPGLTYCTFHVIDLYSEYTRSCHELLQRAQLFVFKSHVICKSARPPLWSSGQSSWLQIQRPGFDSWHYQIFWEVVGLERGPLSLMSTTEELLDRKV